MLRRVLPFLILAAVILFIAWIGTPRLERALTFFPVRTDPRAPSIAPPDARELWFDTADGVRLHGWLLQHHATTQSRGPLLYSHGNTGNLADFLPAAEKLRRQGFDVMLWDYRGYGRSGGEVRDEAALYRDADAALRTITIETQTPPAGIVHYGYSLGSAVATELAVRAGCRAIALESPFASALDQARVHLPTLPLLLAPFAANRFETKRKIARVRCPVLVIHGDTDEVIPVAQGKAVYAAAPDPKRLAIVPGGLHWMAPQTGWTHLDIVGSFVDQPAAR